MHVAEFFLIRKSETEYYKKRLLTLGKSRRKRDQGHIRAGESFQPLNAFAQTYVRIPVRVTAGQTSK
jgi:hypothetical protein